MYRWLTAVQDCWSRARETRQISVFLLVPQTSSNLPHSLVPEPPSPPLNVRLNVDGIGTTSIGIQWFPPDFEGFPPFSSYNFYVDPPTGFNYSTPRLNELNETTRAFTVTGLLPGVTYRLTVTAVSEAFGAVAKSDHSIVLEATTNFTGRNMAVWWLQNKLSVNSFLPNNTIWCHHGHGLSISLWKFIWGV